MSYLEDAAPSLKTIEDLLAGADLQLTAALAQNEQDQVAIAELVKEVARLQAIIDAGTPPPVPAKLMPWGCSTDRRARLEADQKATFTAERCYDQPGMHASGAAGVPNKISDTHIMQVPAGYLPVYSFKTSDWIAAANQTGPAAVDFEAFLRSIDRDVIIIPNHEPENDARGTVSGKTQAQAFVGMVTNYCLIAKRVNNPHVQMWINLMGWWIDNIGSGGTENSEKYIPAGANKDFQLGISWDNYQTSASSTINTIFDKAAALSAKYGSAFAIGETGTTIDSTAWVNAVSKYCDEKKAAFACYWPSQVSATTANYYPQPKDFPAFKAVALKYGGKAL
jgi:hypothetical protein